MANGSTCGLQLSIPMIDGAKKNTFHKTIPGEVE